MKGPFRLNENCRSPQKSRFQNLFIFIFQILQFWLFPYGCLKRIFKNVLIFLFVLQFVFNWSKLNLNGCILVLQDHFILTFLLYNEMTIEMTMKVKSSRDILKLKKNTKLNWSSNNFKSFYAQFLCCTFKTAIKDLPFRLISIELQWPNQFQNIIAKLPLQCCV